MSLLKENLGKLLVANRGEIACRIFATAKRLGIPTVAVYSEADKDSLHVRLADEAVCIGGAAAAESYLNVDNILDAIEKTNSGAVHPGYGFLSERADFAEAIDKKGCRFVGPPPGAIRSLGDKISAKDIAIKAGVSVVPGKEGEVKTASEAVKVAQEVGYPVMIKAAAGGGGRGMRVAYNDEEVKEFFELAAGEAMSAFGDGRLLIERFLESPRHIEVQLLADSHGNVIFLPERECSIQRRNQKVLEESPSPVVSVEMRDAMGSQAVALAKAVGYTSAGTIEFLLDSKSNKFFFLEMNTRLQVEHPITEEVTGLDLVEQMLRIAAGEPLEINQTQVKVPRGHAIEARICAEDPSNEFFPSAGQLAAFRVPKSVDGKLRIDTGFQDLDEVSLFYDSMIAKVITHSEKRADALKGLTEALDKLVIRGPRHNTPFLRALLAHPEVECGDMNTSFIANHFPTGYDCEKQNLSVEDTYKMATVAVVIFATRKDILQLPEKMIVTIHDDEQDEDKSSDTHIPLSIQRHAANRFIVTLPDGKRQMVDKISHSRYLFEGAIEEEQCVCQITKDYTRGFGLLFAGKERRITVQSTVCAEMETKIPRQKRSGLKSMGAKAVLSPMPGKLATLFVQVGETVSAGAEVAVVEAMKMRNSVRTASGGTVKAIHFSEGASLAHQSVILEFE